MGLVIQTTETLPDVGTTDWQRDPTSEGALKRQARHATSVVVSHTGCGGLPSPVLVPASAGTGPLLQL